MLRTIVLLSFCALLSTAVPAEASIRELVETIDLSGVAVSPDGTKVAFRQDHALLEGNRRVSNWWVVNARGGAPAVRVADGGVVIANHAGGADYEQPQWSADSRHFYVRAVIKDAAQVWRVSADGGDARQVTDEDGNVERFTLDPASERLLVTVGPSRAAIARAEQDEYENGIRIDATIDPAQSLFRTGELEGRRVSQRLIGDWFERGTLLAGWPRQEKVIEPGADAPRPVTDADRASFAPYMRPVLKPGQAPEARAPGGAVAKISTGHGDHHLEAVGSDGIVHRCRTLLCARADYVVWRPGHDEVVFAEHDKAQAQALYRWRPGSDETLLVAQSDGLLSGDRYRSTACSVGAEAAFCVTAAAMTPPRLERIELDGGVRTELAAPNRLPSEAESVRVERLDWRDAEGRSFAGQLFLPIAATAAKLPLFVVYYVCEGYLRGGTGDEFPLATMASQGVAALCINKGVTEAKDAGRDYDLALGGIRAAVDLLAERGVIDRERVGQGGLSFGSEVTMWVAWHSNLLKAASIASPQLEPIYFWFNGMAGRKNHRLLRERWGLGAPEETPRAWKLQSAAANADRIHAALLMQMPEQEFRLNMELAARLSNSRTPIEMYAFPDAAHVKWQPRQKLATYERNLDWFNFWLQGKEDPDPAKAAQYARWRKLRDVRDAGRKAG